MKQLKKIFHILRSEFDFLLQHKWGISKPGDVFAISKAEFKKYLPVNPVIIDCGAHIGTDSIQLARVFPKSKVHSFEPVPSVFDVLKKNAVKFPNIQCHQLALSNQNGTAKMFVSSGGSDASSSLLEPGEHLNDHPNVHFDNSISVQTITLDQWAADNGIEKVDLLWLDMQGFEYNMLRASEKILPQVKAIFTEVSTKESYREVMQYSGYKSWLEQIGFRAVKELIPKGADMGNVLFVRG